VSFQRFELPADGVVLDVPSSLGALPVGKDSDNSFLLPVAENEAFWIGLVTTGPEPAFVALQVALADGTFVNAFSGQRWREDAAHAVRIDSHAAVAGVPGQGGLFHAFARVATPQFPAARSVRLVLSQQGDDVICCATVTLVDYATFAALTGLCAPPPLDRDAGYKGWRLP